MPAPVVNEPGSARVELDAVVREFPDIPFEACVKEDCLRRGIWFTPAALEQGRSAYARKSYFIFSFDHLPPSEIEGAIQKAAPEEIALQGGPRDFSRVIVSVRLNPNSPYVVDVRDGAVVLSLEGQPLCEVAFSPVPPYYGQTCEDGTAITEVAPSIEWGYLLYLTVFRMCQYFGKEEECQFCDINRNFKEQRKLGNPYFAIKPVDRLMDALEKVVASGAEARAYTLTGGSVTSTLDKLDEASFYVRYAEAIEERFPGRWIGKMVVQALPAADVRRIHDAGIKIYHPNYEIWDPGLFEKICPGKARYVGRDEWIARILASAEIFEPSRVIPNFVAGIEMSRPHGFVREEDAWASTGEGLDFFMQRGIAPRFTTWCPEPLSVLGRDNGPSSLRYHVGLLRVWRDTHARHHLPAPPGYGQPGLGRGVFSVSSFMDVIDPATPTAAVPL